MASDSATYLTTREVCSANCADRDCLAQLSGKGARDGINPHKFRGLQILHAPGAVFSPEVNRLQQYSRSAQDLPADIAQLPERRSVSDRGPRRTGKEPAMITNNRNKRSCSAKTSIGKNDSQGATFIMKRDRCSPPPAN